MKSEEKEAGEDERWKEEVETKSKVAYTEKKKTIIKTGKSIKLQKFIL